MSWIDLTPNEMRVIAQRCADACPGLVDKIAELDLSDRERALHDRYIELASERYAYGSDGDVEIDDNAAVSIGESGAYVMGWLYIYQDDTGACEKCGAMPGTSEYGTVGDGYDGLCANCADKAEGDDE